MSDLSSADRNAINLKMRQAPWYQQWFRAQGLNPNQVQLSDSQRQDLANVAAQNGMPLPDHALIDQAGNVNIQHGFAGLPTWAKIAIAAAPVAATAAFAPEALGSLGSIAGGGGGSTAAAAGAGATAGGVGAGTTAATAGTLGSIGAGLTKLAPTLIGAGANLYATKSATNANTQAAQLQAKSASDALAYTKERDAQQLAEDQKTRDINMGLFREREARLAPYRQFGAGSLQQLGQPIPGTLGAIGARA